MPSSAALSRRYVLHGLEHAFAEVTLLVAVAQLDRFARAGGRARGHGRASHDTGIQNHIGFNRGIAAGIDDFAPDDFNNATHRSDSSKGCCLTASSSALSVDSKISIRPSGQAFGPSLNALAGSG